MAAPTRAQRSETADLVTVIVFGILAVIIVASTVATRLWSTFRDEGFAWRITIDQQPVDATRDSGTGSVQGLADELLVISPDVDATTAFFGAASIVLWGLTVLVIVGTVMFVAWSFLRGRFFVRATVRAFDVIGWALVIGGITVIALERMTRNGVLSSLDGTGEPLHPLDFWAFAPVWGIGVAMGLLGHAFRRGIRLQQEKATLEKETEGLV